MKPTKRSAKRLLLLTLLLLFATSLMAQEYDTISKNGFFVRITPTDTSYFALISEHTTGKDLDFIINEVRNYGAELSVNKIGVTFGAISSLTLRFYSPKHGEDIASKPRSSILGAYYNRSFPRPFGIGAVDNKYINSYANLPSIYKELSAKKKIELYINSNRIADELVKDVIDGSADVPASIRYIRVILSDEKAVIEVKTA